MQIKTAEEKLVSFACVNVDTYRHFGRLGFGAVFGSKNLKAMVIYGERDEKINDYITYRACAYNWPNH